jgi:hypothetical protein
MPDTRMSKYALKEDEAEKIRPEVTVHVCLLLARCVQMQETVVRDEMSQER